MTKGKDQITEYLDGLNYYNIPGYMRDGIRLYLENGVCTGAFLSAIFSNAGFKEVFEKADDYNAMCIRDYALFCYNQMPGHSQGSKQAFNTWCKSGGLRGQEAMYGMYGKDPNDTDTDQRSLDDQPFIEDDDRAEDALNNGEGA